MNNVKPIAVQDCSSALSAKPVSMSVQLYPGLYIVSDNRKYSAPAARACDQLADYSASDRLLSILVVNEVKRYMHTLVHKVDIPPLDDFSLTVQPE